MKPESYVLCIDNSLVERYLDLNSTYVIENVKNKSIQLYDIDTNIFFRKSRFISLDFKVGDKVKLIKCIENVEPYQDWYPKLDKTYTITKITKANIFLDLNVPIQCKNPMWHISYFTKVDENIETKQTKKIKPKHKIILKNTHKHDCTICKKELFPKSTCRCEVVVDFDL